MPCGHVLSPWWAKPRIRRALCLAGCLRAGPLQPLLALQTPSGRWGRADTQDGVSPLHPCPPHVALGSPRASAQAVRAWRVCPCRPPTRRQQRLTGLVTCSPLRVCGLRSAFGEPAGHCGVLGGVGASCPASQGCRLHPLLEGLPLGVAGPGNGGRGPVLLLPRPARPDCSGTWARPPPSLHWAWCPRLELGVGLPCPSRPFQPHQASGDPTPLCSPSAPPSWVPGTPPRLPTHQEKQTLALFRGSSGRLSRDLRAPGRLTRRAQPSARSRCDHTAYQLSACSGTRSPASPRGLRGLCPGFHP